MGTSTVRLRPGGAAGGHRTGRWVCIPLALAVLVATLLAWRALAARERSPLPEIVLVKGLLLAVSLGAAVYLAQTARQRTQAAEAAWGELEAEIAERKRAERQQHARVAQQRAVAELGQRALAGAGLQALLDEAVRSVAAALELEYAKVLELLPGGEALRLRAGVGWKEGLVGQATVGAELDSQAGYTLLTRDP